MGFPMLHHYQTLPHIISGALATVFGVRSTYAWSLYLLLASWPIAVYVGGRLMGWDRWQSGFAALISPLILGITATSISGRSASTYGYEWRSYTWGGGAGVWAQLWSMWLLPLTWGLTWRAVSRRGGYVVASIASSLTLACHFLTGYLALGSIGAWVVVTPSAIRERLRRGIILLVGSLLLTVWLIIPLLQDNRWSSKSDYLVGWSRDSYGASRVVWWFISGRLFDYHRAVPFISILVGVGLLVCMRNWKDERARGLVAVWSLSFLLLMGRTVVGPILTLVPGGDEVLLPRMIIGVHLAGLYLAAIAAVSIAHLFQMTAANSGPLLNRLVVRGRERPVVIPLRTLGATAVGLVVIPILSGAWVERARFAETDEQLIRIQEVADAGTGAELLDLVDFARRRGAGRFYGGTCAVVTRRITSCSPGGAEPWHLDAKTWGGKYRIGAVPVYTALANADVDVVGYPFRTGSILTDVEARIDDSNAAQYDLFNIRYLILPEDRAPAVPATFLRASGPHRLWEVETTGYLKVIDTRGSISADRGSVGEATESFMNSKDLVRGIHPTMTLGQAKAQTPILVSGKVSGSAGKIVEERSRARVGAFSATVMARRPAAVMLKASFHGRWTAEVDGHPQRPYLVAPGYGAVTVTPGRHEVSFRYRPYPRYGLLFAVAALALLGLFVLSRRERQPLVGRRRVIDT
jgi:hypothetical protein